MKPGTEAENRQIAHALARVLYLARAQRRLTQMQLAERMGLARTYVAKIESGWTTPGLMTLHRFGLALETEGWKLLSRAEWRLLRRPSAAREPGASALVSPVPGTTLSDAERARMRELMRVGAGLVRTLGETLRAARLQRQLTREQLGERSNVSIGRLSRYERGDQEPTIAVLRRLAAALETPAWNVLRCAELRL